LIQIDLENAIRAVKGALDAEVKDPIPATEVMAGPRTGFEQTPTKRHYFQELRVVHRPFPDSFHHSEASMREALPEVQGDGTL
jgi:hypothetical protein